MRKIGLRPHVSALWPTRMAMGTITICAVIMQAAMNKLLAC